MKIVAISDTHNRHRNIKLPEGDIIVHSGDATGRGTHSEVQHFLDWYSKLDYKHKIFVPGNHDMLFESDPALTKQMCVERGIILLNDSGIEIDGLKFWGSAVSPWFHNWAFNRRRTQEDATRFGDKWIKEHWDLIPEGTDVLITHGPPYKILDQLTYVDGTLKNEFVGCEDLLAAIQRVKPGVHIFGHIHCGYGEKHVDGTSFYNAAICDETYSASNSPHVIEV